jgi:hypothetical protein
MPISARKKAVLHVAKAQARFSDKAYREFLLEHAGVSSSNDLTDATFEKVMRALERKENFVSTARRARRDRSVPRPASMRTDEQQQMIDALYRARGWTDRRRQAGFNRRCCKKAWPQTRTDAQKVIEGSKSEGLHYIARLEERLLCVQGRFSREGYDLREPADIVRYTEFLHEQLTALGSQFADLQDRPARNLEEQNERFERSHAVCQVRCGDPGSGRAGCHQLIGIDERRHFVRWADLVVVLCSECHARDEAQAPF